MKKTVSTFGDNVVEVRKAILDDLNAIKQLADAHRYELGFIMRPALQQSIERQEVYVATHENKVAGFVDYHHRRDKQTTLYHVAVSPNFRKRGIGRHLVEALREEAQLSGKEFILLKCPLPLAANIFYEKLGWEKIAIEQGKIRSLAVWRLRLDNGSAYNG